MSNGELRCVSGGRGSDIKVKISGHKYAALVHSLLFDKCIRSPRGHGQSTMIDVTGGFYIAGSGNKQEIDILKGGFVVMATSR